MHIPPPLPTPPPARRRPLPVRNGAHALRLLAAARSDPARHETLAFLLDADGIGGVVTVISGTEPPDAMLQIVELMCRAGERVPDLCSLVVASVRPDSDVLAGDVLAGDVDRWLEASSIAHGFGLQLLEWYVIGRRGTVCPRDLLGEPERWP